MEYVEFRRLVGFLAEDARTSRLANRSVDGLGVVRVSFVILTIRIAEVAIHDHSETACTRTYRWRVVLNMRGGNDGIG